MCIKELFEHVLQFLQFVRLNTVQSSEFVVERLALNQRPAIKFLSQQYH